MGLNVSVTITMDDGEKPTFTVNGEWETHLADFNLSVTTADGQTVVIPSANFNTP